MLLLIYTRLYFMRIEFLVREEDDEKMSPLSDLHGDDFVLAVETIEGSSQSLTWSDGRRGLSIIFSGFGLEFNFFFRVLVLVVQQEDLFKQPSAIGLSPWYAVFFLFGGLTLVFVLGNYALYLYARKTNPPKKKVVSKKKMKKEWLKTLSADSAGS